MQAQTIQMGDGATAVITKAGKDVNIELSSTFAPGTESEGYSWKTNLKLSSENVSIDEALKRVFVTCGQPHALVA